MNFIDVLEAEYRVIASRLVKHFGRKINLLVSKKGNVESNSFNVSLEILVREKKDSDDYGLVLSTNCQSRSHLDISAAQSDENLFVISDLSTGEGRIIASTEQFVIAATSSALDQSTLATLIEFAHIQEAEIPILLKTNFKI